MTEAENLLHMNDEAYDATIRLSDSGLMENVIALKWTPDLLDELEGLSRANRPLDVCVIDCTQNGFLFPSEVLIKAADLSPGLLQVQGALVFVTRQKATAIIKETASGHLSIHNFNDFSQVYDFSTVIAKHIQSALGHGIEIKKDSTNLSEQILLTSVPVLTQFGIKLKAGAEGSRRRNLVLSAIDNYTPLSVIAQRLATQLSFDQLLDELKGLEHSGIIYPIFPRIPFLVQCYRSGRPFKLKDYLLEAKLLSPEQLDETVFTLQNSRGNQKLSLGALCVAKGFISSRQLEIALQDQAFFGSKEDSEKLGYRPEADSKVQSLVGNLGSTDPSNLLQNLVTNRSTGVLSVEHKDLQFRAFFNSGKLSHVRQGKLKGNEAVIEFVSVWKQGIFVFIERQPPADLVNEDCSVTKPIEKLLLDSALASDNMEAIWKKLPKGIETSLEALQDVQGILKQQDLIDPLENTLLSSQDLSNMQIIWRLCDGLAPIFSIIRKLETITTLQAAMTVNRLLHYRLVRIADVDIAKPLAIFQEIIAAVTQHIGLEKSIAILRISLRDSLGYSARARIFTLGQSGEIGIDIAAAKSSNVSLSLAIKSLEEWQIKYLDSVSLEIDRNILKEIHRQAYQRHPK